jgi:hypothetical protein
MPLRKQLDSEFKHSRRREWNYRPIANFAPTP